MKYAYKELCNNFAKNFLVTALDNPRSALLLLRNVYLALADKNVEEQEKTALITAYDSVKQKLEERHVQALWNGELIDAENSNLVRSKMLREISFAKYITEEQLLALTKTNADTREIVVAIIRKHLNDQKKEDPFDNGFNFQLLLSMDQKGASSYLAGFISNCSVLPIKTIVQLSATDIFKAKEILLYINDCADYFEISSRIAELYPDLRKGIIQHWKDYLQTFPLAKEQKTFLQLKLSELQNKYPEFKDINLKTRLKRFISTFYSGDSLSYGAKICMAGVIAECLDTSWTLINRSNSGAVCFSEATGAALECSSLMVSRQWLLIRAAALVAGGYYLIKRDQNRQEVLPLPTARPR